MRAMKRAGCAVSALILALALVLGLLFAVPVFAETQGQEDAAKQPVNYYLTADVKKSLADNGLTYTDFNYFNGIRWTTEAYASQADSNWWGYASVYMGLSENGEGVDLTQYSTVNLEVWGISQNATWIIAGFVDGAGRYARLNGDAIKGNKDTVCFDGTRFGAGEAGADIDASDYVDASSDWRGAFIGNMCGELKVQPEVQKVNNNQNSTGQIDTYTLSDQAFDWTDVGAMFVRYHTWDAKTIQTGKVTLVDAEGERTEVFDPAAAQQITETKNLTGIGTLTNAQWYYGPQPSYANEHGYTDLIAAGALEKASATYEEERAATSDDPSVWDIHKVKTGGDVWAQMFESAEGTAPATYTDISSYSGICLELDTTGLESQYIEIDVAIKLAPNDIYKAFGNTVNASYVLENGTVILNKELQKGANWIPQGVQGKMYIPFGAFELNGKLLTDVENFGQQITEMHLIFVNSSFAEGDAMTIKNVQAFVCDEHADVNHDQLCDYCAASVPCTEHIDEDHNQKCDYCEAEVPCTHTDADKDHECDWCGAEVNMPHADENNDGKCDYCGAQMSTSDPGDAETPGGDENPGGTTDDGKGGCSGSVVGISLGVSAGVLLLAVGVVLALVLRKKKG